MSFQSKDAAILGQQNKVQELVVRFADLGVYSASGAVVTIDLGEAVSIANCAHFDNSVPGIVHVTVANCAVTGNSVAITLANALAANDSIVLRYVVSE